MDINVNQSVGFVDLEDVAKRRSRRGTGATFHRNTVQFASYLGGKDKLSVSLFISISTNLIHQVNLMPNDRVKFQVNIEAKKIRLIKSAEGNRLVASNKKDPKISSHVRVSASQLLDLLIEPKIFKRVGAVFEIGKYSLEIEIPLELQINSEEES